MPLVPRTPLALEIACCSLTNKVGCGHVWMTEPFMQHWEWWVTMLEPVSVRATDVLNVTLIDQARGPVRTWQRYRGLDQLKARIKAGELGVIIRRIPNPIEGELASRHTTS